MQILAVILSVIALTALVAWLGEAIILNFIVIPAVRVLDEAGRTEFIGRHFVFLRWRRFER